MIEWGKIYGFIGIWYWVFDFSEWGSMLMFDYLDNNVKVKKILMDVIYEEIN